MSGFDDHTRPRFDDASALLAYMAQGPGRSQAKFVVSDYYEESQRDLYIMQGDFYAMHDEWYWFRLLNNAPVPGVDTEPVAGLGFGSVEAIRSWARTQEELPLDLRWVSDSRLYSPLFYELSLNDPRSFGLGSLVYIPPRGEPEPRPELWLFELEYVDSVSYEQLVTFFEILTARLPTAIAAQLTWVVRSPAQQALADYMASEQLPYWDRITSYAAVTVPGEAEVYSPGITAGRLKMVRPGGGGYEGSRPSDILVLGEIPDFLPQAAALITSVPQTPLAHVNILARNRGIPNAYLAGVLDDPGLDQLARAHVPVLVYAETPDRVTIQPMSNADYNAYLQLGVPPQLSLPEIDVSGAPLAVELDQLALEEMADQRPIIGGKSAGFVALLDQLDDGATSIAAPPSPLAITIKPYLEHLADLRPSIEAMLADETFSQSAPARLLVLEGEASYDARFPAMDQRAFRQAFVQIRPPGDPVGDLVRAGGLCQVLRDAEIAPATLQAIEAVLGERFGHYATGQGLRFRSSSNVEDIEGFNGAGLYSSNTGFLDATSQQDPDDRHQTVAWALKKTWASYWGAEAFEERRTAGVDHLSGAMGVLVHARFDDPLEAANGVFTLTLQKVDGDYHSVMEVNSQAGAMSVTNPEPGSNALPEVVRLSQTGLRAAVEIERLQASTEQAEGAVVLFDSTLHELFERAGHIARRWLDEDNRTRHIWRQSHTLVLDFEYRLMREGWPALASGTPLPPRMIVKQARSLDPGLAHIPDSLLNQPIPRDILGRARRVEHRVCSSASFTLLTLEVYTDPNLQPDMGFGASPFNAFVSMSFAADIPDLGLSAGHRFAYAHTDYVSSHPLMEGTSWDLHVELTPAAAAEAGFSIIDIKPEGYWLLIEGEDYALGSNIHCSTTALYTTPEDFLLGLLQD